MRAFVAGLLFIGLLVKSTHAEDSPGDCVNPIDGHRCGSFESNRARFQRGMPRAGTLGPGDPQPETPWTDVLHTKIDISVDFEAQTINGVVTINAESRINGLNQFVVYLNPNGNLMRLSSIGGNVASPVSFAHVGDKVTVALDAVYNTGQTFSVSFNYGGQPASGAAYWGSHGSPPVKIMATFCEPFDSRNWWIGKDVLDDKCTFDPWFTVPENYVAVSNGILQGVDTMPFNKVRYRWAEINQMAPYLASVAIADYQVYSTTYNHLGDTMPMTFYMLPEYNVPFIRSRCDTYVTSTEVFSDKFGQYPFINEKGGMAHTPTLPVYMEHQTIPSMSNFDYDAGLANQHELAHQWWGDMITCETWGDIWLNEGFATFSEAIWVEFKPGGSATAYHDLMSNYRWPYSTDAQVYVTDVNDAGAIFDNIVYDKGAWVLHMLRHVLGDPEFFQSLLDYRAAYEGDSATTAEFISSVSGTAGYDLTFFTDQWIMNPGSPDYDYGWQHLQTGGHNYLLLRVSQTQSSRGFPEIIMPVDIRVTTGSGTSTYVVWCAAAVETFAIPIAGVPTQVALDPDGWILKHSVTQSALGVFPTLCQGDMDGNGKVDGRDIQAFVNASIDSVAWPLVWKRSDMDFNGRHSRMSLCSSSCPERLSRTVIKPVRPLVRAPRLHRRGRGSSPLTLNGLFISSPAVGPRSS
jgi:aminopeptidase N